MKSLYFVFILIIFAIINFSSSYGKDASVAINKNKQKGGIPRTIYGSFLEFLYHFVNSKYGFWSQEIENRGFDLPADSNSISQHWYAFPSEASGSHELVEGGYNKNGVYCQRITKSDNSEGTVGICQELLVNGDIGQEVYIYFKGNNSNPKLKIKIYSKDFTEVLFVAESNNSTDKWSKMSVSVPALHHNFIQFSLVLDDLGSIDLDEVSLMPEDNVEGVRREFFEYYKSWRPGVFRYPGGSFADQTYAHWRDGIGDIDQRKSPKLATLKYDQRMDFGTDEFLRFCEALGIEPHIVTNLANGTPEEAAEWVEYCNGSADTPMGRLRAENGRTQPYKVKYWELGNEQFGDATWTANRSIQYNELMKQKDPSILTIVDGNIWGWYWYIQKMMPVVYGKCDIYAWHDTQTFCYDPRVTRDENYTSFMGGINIRENDVKNVINWLKELNCFEGTKIGVSEVWQHYFHRSTDWSDTVLQAFSLESGLWTASLFSMYQRQPDCFILGERTHGLGFLRGGIDTNRNMRSFYPSPTYWALNMTTNHSGTAHIYSETECETFSFDKKSCLEGVTEAKYIDANITATKDTLFISVVNRYINDSAKVTFNINEFVTEPNMQVYELYSPNYTDYNSPEDPDKIKPRQFQIKTTNQYTFPPHSFTILAIPCSDALNDVESETNSKLHTSPNPFNDYVSLAIENDVLGTIEIIDVFGNALYSNSFVGGKDEIRVNSADWPQGVYFIKYTTTDSTTISKIVKISK